MSIPSGREPAGYGPSERGPASVVIVGGGIAGLAAAFFLRDRGVTVTVLEGSPRLGGKLAVSEVAGIGVDEGAEALLARRPEGVGLIGEVGLSGQLVQPGTTAANIWTRGQLRPLPRRQMMGVPADLGELTRSGILSAAGAERARQDLQLPATDRDGDVSVTGYVGARFGQELVDRLVDPLLGGVYAGRSEELSFEATLPGLAAESRRHAALSAAAAALVPAPPTPAGPGPAGSDRAGSEPGSVPRPAPVFTTLAGGLGTLPPVLADASAAKVRTSAMVRELARTPGGWRLTIGSARAPEQIEADAVILALPARPAGRLLAGVPAAAAVLAEIDYASMAVVTLAYPAAAFPLLPGGSGYLVPAVDGRAVKAVTFSSVKWPHLLRPATGWPVGGTLQIVRSSVGRIGEEAVLQRDDDELTALAAGELADATGVRGQPVAARVTRWGGGLPQYKVGHLDRVARIRAGVAAQPGLAVCGAAYDGIGIPACIATARLAADQVLAYLETGVGPAGASEVR
jgi:oxygen-dependent protoporphyrinogen oxidase